MVIIISASFARVVTRLTNVTVLLVPIFPIPWQTFFTIIFYIKIAISFTLLANILIIAIFACVRTNIRNTVTLFVMVS